MDAPEDLAGIIADLPQILEDIAFARALRQLTIITTTGPIRVQFSPSSENVVVDLRSLTATGATPPSQLPSQTGHAGALLTTDGSTVAWT